MTTIYQRALFLALLPLAGCGRSKENSAGIPLSYWFVLAPQSADTYRSDLLENLQFAKNIYAPLVSTYMTGKPQGMAAVSWTVDPSGRVWRFKIRRGLVFEDGTPISPDIVLQNFKRIFWLTRKDGLVLNSLLPEVREMKSMRQPLRSAYATSDEVVFQFSKRPLNLFETISQPIYGIAHPKCFDDEGRWEDPWCLCSSGQYQVKFRSANKIVLKSRHVFQEVAGAPEIVEFHAFNKNANVLNALMAGRCDVAHLQQFALSKKTVEELKRKGLALSERPPVVTRYVQLNHKRGVFTNKNLRRSYRDLFYRNLLSNPGFLASSVEFNPSFIPKGCAGYIELPLQKAKNGKITNGRTINILLYSLTIFPNEKDRAILAGIEESIVRSVEELGLVPRVIRYTGKGSIRERRDKWEFDILISGVGFLIQDPYADLRMMFMSEIGAKVPDASGKIPGLLAQADSETDPKKKSRWLEKIDQLMFDESAAVTFMHDNFLFVHGKGVDLSSVNIFADPIEFRAVGWRPQG